MNGREETRNAIVNCCSRLSKNYLDESRFMCVHGRESVSDQCLANTKLEDFFNTLPAIERIM